MARSNKGAHGRLGDARTLTHLWAMNDSERRRFHCRLDDNKAEYEGSAIVRRSLACVIEKVGAFTSS
jgi:hypothetical protein